jgi:hypothetical protein
MLKNDVEGLVIDAFSDDHTKIPVNQDLVVLEDILLKTEKQVRVGPHVRLALVEFLNT